MAGKRRGRRMAGLVAGVGLTLPAAAQAADIAFSIPEQPREAALLALGRQAGLSLGFAPGARCSGQAGVSGRMDVATALDRLLAGSACVAIRPDARTIVIRPRPLLALRHAAPPPADAAPVRTADLGEVVVTAGKIEQLLSATPYGLTAVGGAELERAGVADDRDLSLLAAGVTVTNLGPGRDKVLLRGLSDGPLTGHTQSTVGLYLGDLRLTYNAPDPDLPLIDVERAEVLRGPQGSLYGAGSIGGILQIIPNAPDPTGRSGRLAAEVSTTESGAPSFGVSGVLNQPLPRGVGALRVAAWSDTAGGYIDNPARGAKDIDRSRRTGVRAGLRWQAASDLAFDAMLVDQSITTRDAHYADTAVGPLAKATATREPHDNDFLAVALAARWSPAWGRLTVSVGALDHDVGTLYDAALAPMSLVPPGAHPKTFADENHIRAVVAEARLSSIGPARFHWTVGGFTAVGEQRLDATLAPIEPVAGYDESRRDRLLELAVFGEASYDLTRDLTLTAGGRVFDSELRTHSAVTLMGPVRDFRGESVQHGVAPKVLLAYRPLPTLTVYVQAAEGYRTAGFNTSGAAGQLFSETGGAQPLRRYAGDELWSYEAGARWRSPVRGLALRAAAFQANWTDIQADLILPSGLPFTANLGDGHSRGVEAEATYARGRLTFSANGVLQDPELTRPAPGIATAPNSGLPGVPKLSFAGTAAYAAPLAGDWDLTLTASYAWVGHSRLAFDAATQPVMGDYSEVRLAADLAHGDLGVRLFVDNLLDRKGNTLAFGNPFSFRAMDQATPERPRTFGMQVRRSF